MGCGQKEYAAHAFGKLAVRLVLVGCYVCLVIGQVVVGHLDARRKHTFLITRPPMECPTMMMGD